MSDYGHPLRFGTFITPGNAPPEAPVELARLSERLGFDLVTFQDHPYQPRFLDTLSLISWTLAVTERVHVAANVHNLPLRPPAVLARAAASLGLLSGGRFELGLGAGAFWDAIEAMGGRRLKPGEAVDAFAQALEVIRGVWDTSTREPLQAGGEFHRVDGAKRGPTPDPRIPIWVGAGGPRMLRLIGREADGWVVTLGRVQPRDLERGNEIIDGAARDAGRDPAEIVRMLNFGGRFASERAGVLQGLPSSWVDDLLPLAVEYGVGTFILASDDPDTMVTFATEVMPSLRDAVAAAR